MGIMDSSTKTKRVSTKKFSNIFHSPFNILRILREKISKIKGAAEGLLLFSTPIQSRNSYSVFNRKNSLKTLRPVEAVYGFGLKKLESGWM
jgi:hypothetical protein